MGRQAVRLPCFQDYLDALGVPDIKELPHGAGTPPTDDPQIFVGGIRIMFMGSTGDKDSHSGEDLRPTCSSTMNSHYTSSLAEYTAPATNRDFFTCPVPDPQDWDVKYNAWNTMHSAIKCVSTEMFVIVGQGAEPSYSPVTAKQVALFVSYNEDLWCTKPKPTGNSDPLGFAEFAQHLNAFDRSGDLWAHYDEETH
jgi:hypothetical protein